MQGPELMTCGPYRPIRLVAYSARISSVDLAALVSEDHASTISGAISVEGGSNHADHVRIRLAHPNEGSVIYEKSIGLEPTEVKNVSSATAHWDLTGKVELWWPAGHGEQQLYELSVDLIDKVGVLT
jgi:beta-mannosidase